MPIFDSVCRVETCDQYNHKFEWYAHRGDQPDPPCESCGQTTRRCVSRFAAIWTKSLAEYGDPKKETYYKDLKTGDGGHVVARKRSHGGTLEKPVFERVTSIAQQRAFCRDEGLVPPTDMPSRVSVKSDGQTLNSSAGEPGVWV